MIWLELLVVLFFIGLGAKLGGIGIGYAGGAGVIVLTAAFGLKAGAVPTDVILIIMSVISLIAAMQTAGGMDYLVHLAEKILRSNPKQVTFLAPMVTYTLTLLAGTGHTAFSVLPVITEVAKEQNIKPCRPLSIAVVASQIAITASPISAALVFFSGLLEPRGVTYLELLAIMIPSTLLACLVGSVVANLGSTRLDQDPVFIERRGLGLLTRREAQRLKPHRNAKIAVLIFLIAILLVVTYAAMISPVFGLIPEPPITRNEAIIACMLAGATAVALLTKIPLSKITDASTFKSGMSACICVLGVAWLGDTFVSNHIEEIKSIASESLKVYPWILTPILFMASMLLYSQAVTTKALMPLALLLGVSPNGAITAFCAVSALFILPTYPTLLAAVELDDTGSTRIGKYVLDHPFVYPGLAAISSGVFFAHFFASVINS